MSQAGSPPRDGSRKRPPGRSRRQGPECWLPELLPQPALRHGAVAGRRGHRAGWSRRRARLGRAVATRAGSAVRTWEPPVPLLARGRRHAPGNDMMAGLTRVRPAAAAGDARIHLSGCPKETPAPRQREGRPVNEPASARPGPEPGASLLGRLLREYREDGRRIAVLSVAAIAAATQGALPEAAAVRLAWNDAGRLYPAGFYTADLNESALKAEGAAAGPRPAPVTPAGSSPRSRSTSRSSARSLARRTGTRGSGTPAAAPRTGPSLTGSTTFPSTTR
jgi:hypothetical protein